MFHEQIRGLTTALARRWPNIPLLAGIASYAQACNQKGYHT